LYGVGRIASVDFHGLGFATLPLFHGLARSASALATGAAIAATASPSKTVLIAFDMVFSSRWAADAGDPPTRR
jgi:hypothetical protein